MKLKLFLVFHKNSALILTILMLVLISFSFSNLVEAENKTFNNLNLSDCKNKEQVKKATDEANNADNAEELLLDIAAFCSGFKVDDDLTSEQRLAELMGQIIRGALTFIGVIFFVLIVFGGFRWMIARGNEEEIKKSRDLIINAAIGLVIIMAAYTLTWFVVEYLATATAIKPIS